MRNHVVIFVWVLVLASNPFAAHAADTSSDYESWLASHQAWDVLDYLAESRPQTPETVLSRARYLQNLNRTQELVQLLQNAGPFTDDLELEGERIWMLAQGLRSAGDLRDSLFHYLQAGKYLPETTYRQRSQQEPDLALLFKSVWLPLYWETELAGLDDSEQASNVILVRNTRQTARNLWPEDPFWKHVEQRLNMSSSHAAASFDVLLIADLKEEVVPAVLQALGAWCMKDWALADSSLDPITQTEVRTFWKDFGMFLKTGAIPSVHKFQKQGLIKPAVFWKLGWSGFKDSPAWFAPHMDDPLMVAYANDLTSMDPKDAADRVAMESGSMLVPDKPKQSLHAFSLALDLVRGDFQRARDRLAKEQLGSLPLTLRLARILLENEYEYSASRSPRYEEALVLLAQAAGFIPEHDKPPFWILVPNEQLEEAVQVFPLDREIRYAFLENQWQDSRTPDTAKKLAQLFPGTRTGYNTLLYLARQAHAAGRTALAWSYLNRIGSDSIPHDREAEFLEARAGLEMELGWEERALSTYSTLLHRYPDRLEPEKKIKLALAAQEQGDWEKAQAILERLWSHNQSLQSSLKAEILFWLGEGAQNMGRLEQALAHYMRLAWAYPEENIWAVTALYRSALLYEQKGQFETAGALLKKVLKLADRESQKKAAQERLDAVQIRLKQHDRDQDFAYPF